MLKEQVNILRGIAIIIDCLVVGCSFILIYLLQVNMPYIFSVKMQNIQELPPFRYYILLIGIVIPLWIGCLSHFGMYQTMREKRFRDLFWTVFNASFLSIIIFSAISFLLKLELLSRTFIVMFFLGTVLLLLIEKILTLFFLYYIRKKGYNQKILLIVGSGKRALDFADIVMARPHWGFNIFGFVDEEDRVGMKVGNYKVIGSINNIAKILDENVVDEVIFILPRKWLVHLEDYIKICEKVGVQATFAIDFFNLSIAKSKVTEIHGWPFLTYDTIPYGLLERFSKRVLDIVISICGLTLLSPLLIIISLIIKLTSKGPVLFRQTRCGLYGRRFKIYKFRTMVINAEECLNELRKFNEREGPVFKILNDPRITCIGKFLRKTSLDELPQLINVLKGDMSLVGPRPPLPSEVSQYERWQRRRLSVRPGIACIHEIIARNNKDFKEWMQMDLEYIDNWSLALDIKILTKTIFTVLKGTGS